MPMESIELSLTLGELETVMYALRDAVINGQYLDGHDLTDAEYADAERYLERCRDLLSRPELAKLNQQTA